MKMRRTHRRINIRRMAKNYPRLPISMSSLPFSPFNFTYIWYLPLTLRLQYTDNIFNAGNFTLSLTFSICIIAMPHPQGKLNSPAWAHSQNRGWDPQQHVTKSWLSPHQHWKHAFEIMIEAPSPRNHTPCLDISSQHTFWLSFTWSLQPLNAQIKLRSSAMVIIPHRTVQFFPPSQFGSSPSDPRIRSPRSAHLDDNFLARPYSALSSTRQTLSAQPLINSAISKLDHYW